MFNVGDKVRWVGHVEEKPYGFEDQTGVVVGYWAAREHSTEFFTKNVDEADLTVGYPYFVRGFIPDEAEHGDSAQCVYSDAELEAVQE